MLKQYIVLPFAIRRFYHGASIRDTEKFIVLKFNLSLYEKKRRKKKRKQNKKEKKRKKKRYLTHARLPDDRRGRKL